MPKVCGARHQLMRASPSVRASTLGNKIMCVRARSALQRAMMMGGGRTTRTHSKRDEMDAAHIYDIYRIDAHLLVDAVHSGGGDKWSECMYADMRIGSVIKAVHGSPEYWLGWCVHFRVVHLTDFDRHSGL